MSKAKLVATCRRIGVINVATTSHPPNEKIEVADRGWNRTDGIAAVAAHLDGWPCSILGYGLLDSPVSPDAVLGVHAVGNSTSPLRNAEEWGGWPVWWERLTRPERIDLIAGENPVLGPDGCFGYRFDPCPVLGLGEDLFATVPVAVPE
jgi:hypothetical protein